jgi:hypothetical protein
LLSINYGEENPIETKSYEVYQYIIRQSDQFAIVHFTAESGAGYYTLLAQKQGLICSSGKFVVSIGNLAPGSLEMIEKGADHVISDVNTLKLDYIVQKTVEMAVCDLEFLSSRTMSSCHPSFFLKSSEKSPGP